MLLSINFTKFEKICKEIKTYLLNLKKRLKDIETDLYNLYNLRIMTKLMAILSECWLRTDFIMKVDPIIIVVSYVDLLKNINAYADP